MPTVRARAQELLARPGVLVIAHRGASAQAPENTLPAFSQALEQGADLVELDVRADRDGALWAFHDATLDRTTDARARFGGESLPLAARGADDLGGLDAGAWFGEAFRGTPIPTLRHALETIQAGAATLVERKTGAPGALLADLRAGGWTRDVVVQAFDWDFLAALHALDGDVARAALGEGPLEPAKLAALARLGAPVAAWRERDLDAAAVARVHDLGMKLWAWTVDDPARARALAALGVDGLITNGPAALRAALAPGAAAGR